MFSELIKQLEAIQGSWDGNSPGIAEDRAHAATEALAKLYDLEYILDELHINE